MSAKREPFHVVKLSHNDVHIGYEIYLDNIPFLIQADRTDLTWRLKRHEAYAICKLLNEQRRDLKWMEKFSDPY